MCKGVAWHGVVWCGVSCPLYGVLRHGMAWLGMACHAGVPCRRAMPAPILAWHGMVLRVECGMHDVAWHGMAYYVECGY